MVGATAVALSAVPSVTSVVALGISLAIAPVVVAVVIARVSRCVLTCYRATLAKQ